jgi:ERCC4-type nuclease
MKIKIDHREHDLIQSCKYFLGIGPAYQGIELEICNLPIGDIILCDDNEVEKVIVERKSLSDLASSIKDGRYEEQSYRLNGISHPNHNIMYIIEGEMNKVNSFKTRIDKSVLYSAIFSLNYYKGFSVLRSQNLEETAIMICHMTYKLKKGIIGNLKPYYDSLIQENSSDKAAGIQSLQTPETLENSENSGIKEEKEYCHVVKRVKKENITTDNIGEIMLCQIPGISSITAIAIMAQFKNLPNLIFHLKENPQSLKDISYSNAKGQTRKISKPAIENIKKFLRSNE